MRERLLLVQQGEHGVVGVGAVVLLEHRLADQRFRELLLARQIGGRGKAAFIIDRAVHRQPDLETELIVIGTMARGDMHEAGAGVAGDKLGGIESAGAGAERVFVFHLREFVGVQ